MKRIIKAFVVIFAVTLSFVSNSCDKFDTFPLNIPFSVTVVIQGSSNPSAAIAQYCLTESNTYQDYVEDIEKLTFIQAAWRTDSVKAPLTGTIEVTVKVVGGATLFQKTLAGTNPADYTTTPFVLPLTAAEIQAMNDYLNSYLENPNQCLEASVEVTVTSGTPPYYLRGIVDMVVEAETKF
jgi:hypothetical protein